MNAIANETGEFPNIASLTAEQKRQLLAMLIKEELAQRPFPFPIVVQDDDKNVLGVFRPNSPPFIHPGIESFSPAEREELARRARDPRATFTTREIRALEEIDGAALR